MLSIRIFILYIVAIYILQISTIKKLNYLHFGCLYFTANTGLYAHYVFKTLDSDRSGIVSFEVSHLENQSQH